ncbi:putative ATP-dependent helicase Lhr [Clostridioides difficile]|nr:putative ATP-dependent helicase Lhr [Clostridioides difficile]CZS00532.1 putative ATP-dependent helicase Lhr [Clostridioides difficile]
MAKGINPIRFANEVNENFLNYQLTAFPFTDENLNKQAKNLIKGEGASSPMIKGPFVSLSKSFLEGMSIKELEENGKVHPALAGVAPFPTLFKHQEKSLLNIQKYKHCLVSTGTGSGKTESFMLPIIDYCLKLRDQGARKGIVAILVYPMNALANDQLDRLRGMLAGSGVSFGMYVGSTPEDDSKLGSYYRMNSKEGKKDYYKHREGNRASDMIISPFEERLSEKEMIENPPRILLTNVNQLELLLTRKKDISMFVNAPLKYIVFDEVHTYSGAKGAEVSCLVRRLKAFCNKSADEVVCIGTSATIADKEDEGSVVGKFASRFFGVNEKDVVLVKEEYKNESFIQDKLVPRKITNKIENLLDETLNAIESEDEAKIEDIYNTLTNSRLDGEGDIKARLYENLRRNEYVYNLVRILSQPESVEETISKINRSINRDAWNIGIEAQIELLCYLALGAFAEKEGNPLLRPKVHYFVKGLEGVVTTFEKHEDGKFYPKMYMNMDEAMEKNNILPTGALPTLVCGNCGQHYFEGYYENLIVEDKEIFGGEAVEGNRIWLSGYQGMDNVNRAVLTDSFFVEESDDEESAEKAKEALSKKKQQLYMCSVCGTLHKHDGDCKNDKCRYAGPLVPMYIMSKLEGGKLFQCATCGHRGSKKNGEVKREGIRPLSATTVSDTHILSQNMINSSEGETQKLIVFADNRQDAAFQAGWMQDHTRRYRFRHLIYEYLREKNSPASIGDILEYLMNLFTKDMSLARTLAPEVFDIKKQEAYSSGLEDLLETYLRIIIVRELGTAFKQRDSLETWGVVKVLYYGINTGSSFIKAWANKLEIDEEELVNGINSLLDKFRREGSPLIYDDSEVFTRYWREGDREVQRGFIPLFNFPPKGLAKRAEGPKKMYMKGFEGPSIKQFISNWKVKSKYVSEFVDELWVFLTQDIEVLKEVSLKGGKNNILSGVYQIDSAKIGLITQMEFYKCNVCQRVHSRHIPNNACTTYRCQGKIEKGVPSKENYNVNMLNSSFSMVVPREHSAQVPAKDREIIEDQFKSNKGNINCLIATPTLEMGVDIGALDMVLMRNVPPKPANYWQRAGRAGRKHRMAVVYTYCRRSEHDRYFFEDPLRMLDGKIDPPKFNLRNEIMIKKHVHATVISQFIRMTQLPTLYNLDEKEVDNILDIMNDNLPRFIKDYLFYNDSEYRDEAYNVASFNTIILKYKPVLLEEIKKVFKSYWPEDDSFVVCDEQLEKYLDEMTESLQDVVNRLHKRMKWAVNKLRELSTVKLRKLLEKEDEKLEMRCKSYIDKMRRPSLETYTLSVLAVEGFLPGYGVFEGSIRAHLNRNTAKGINDLELSRATSMAVREFVPGNMIYANGSRFKTTLYHFPAQKEQFIPDEYVINTEKGIIKNSAHKKDVNKGYGDEKAIGIVGVPICDTTISYVSRISDEEVNRFQLPVVVLGYLKKPHRGIKTYKLANGKEFNHRFGQQIRLVNIGPADKVQDQKLGYPICTVCGATRSPYASDKDIANFMEMHEKTCSKPPSNIVLSADSTVDGLLFTGLEEQADAVNLAEALRIGASLTIEMEANDLQYLVIANDDDTFDVFLYDSMPGGSGLLQQMIDNWVEMIQRAVTSLNQCSGRCEASCYDCMKTYNNVFVHKLLDRQNAVQLLLNWLMPPNFEKELPPVVTLEDDKASQGTNAGEVSLFNILKKEGFPNFEEQKIIKIGAPYNRTLPDLYYEDEDDEVRVAVYLDGLSNDIHGNEKQIAMDNMIRNQLEDMDIEVVSIAVSDLNDPEALNKSLRKLARKIQRKDLVKKYK